MICLAIRAGHEERAVRTGSSKNVIWRRMPRGCVTKWSWLVSGETCADQDGLPVVADILQAQSTADVKILEHALTDGVIPLGDAVENQFADPVASPAHHATTLTGGQAAAARMTHH